jgi:hypothetical protein
LESGVDSLISEVSMNRVRVILIMCSTLAGSSAVPRAGELKVDINRGTKNQTTYTEVGYTNWYNGVYTDTPATGTNADTQVFTSSTGETLTIKLSQSPASASRGGLG